MTIEQAPDQGPGGESGVAGGDSPTAIQPEAIGGSSLTAPREPAPLSLPPNWWEWASDDPAEHPEDCTCLIGADESPTNRGHCILEVDADGWRSRQRPLSYAEEQASVVNATGA